jgi:hypothetical protein
MNYYYVDSANQSVGPVPLDQLHNLYRDGTINLETYIRPESTEEWQQYRSIRPTVPPPGRDVIPGKGNSPGLETSSPEVPAAAATKTCPFCAETIAAAAKKCKHCGETLDVALRAAEEALRISSHQPNVYMNAGGGAVTGAGIQKHNFPHLLHFLVAIITAGLWFPIWILHYIFRDRNYYCDINNRNGYPTVQPLYLPHFRSTPNSATKSVSSSMLV